MAPQIPRRALSSEVQLWLTALSAHTDIGIALLTAETDVLYASATAAKIFGYAPDEFVGIRGFELVHPDDIAGTQHVSDDALREPGSTFTIVNRMRHRDGSWRWIESRATNYTHDPLFGVMLVSFRDVTASKEAEQTLAEQELRYQSFIQQSTEGIWRFELDAPFPVSGDEDTQIDAAFRHGYLAECNDAMARMYGYDRAEELVGARLSDLLPRDDPRNIEYIRAFLRSGYRLENSESAEIDRYGEQRFFLNNLIGIVEQGALKRIWGTQRDVTERRRLEAERDQLLVDEQTARAAAEDALVLRNTFLSVAAHELRTPLTALLGNAEILQRRIARDPAFPAEYARPIGVIVEQTKRLAKLVSSLLDISRIENGRLDLDRERLDVADLVRRVTTEAEISYPKHTIRYTGGDERVWICGDALRLEQVLQNLLDNAVKYSPEGGNVVVQLGQDDRAASISISDSGIGIDPEAVPHLFERFFRASNSAAAHTPGMGIGLYVVQEIVALHGGTVTVDTALGTGSTFTITLPIGDC